MVNKPLIRPYFWGGTLGGGRLTSHDLLKVTLKKRCLANHHLGNRFLLFYAEVNKYNGLMILSNIMLDYDFAKCQGF